MIIPLLIGMVWSPIDAAPAVLRNRNILGEYAISQNGRRELSNIYCPNCEEKGYMHIAAYPLYIECDECIHYWKLEDIDKSRKEIREIIEG